MLEVRCGIADYSHENEFFRFFSRELKGFFDEKGLDGILLGMPTSLVMTESLQIDALLITDSMIVIIDFKDYDGVLTLPDEDDFFGGAWLTNEGIRVKGGNSPNPYSQLSKQRGKLKGILDRTCRNDMGSFEVRHIKTMVCFSGEMDFENRVPRQYSRTFSVTDRRYFIEAIFDAVNVNRLGAGLLNERFKENLAKLFKTEEYDCTIKIVAPPSGITEDQAPEVEEGLASAIRTFASNESDVLIIRGNESADRWSAAHLVQDAATEAGFAHAPILVPTRKIAEHLAAEYSPEGSLYSEIYDASEKRTKDGRDLVPLRNLSDVKYDDVEAPALRMRTMLIVCEAQLVSDSEWSDSQVVFGSGRLLADILEYLHVGKEPRGRNKVVFIGDAHQLCYGSVSQSCLSETAYDSTVSVETRTIERENASNSIEALCETISSYIDAHAFSVLELRQGEDISVIQPTREDVFALMSSAAHNWPNHRIVAYTNDEAMKVNRYVKKAVIKNGATLAPGDILLVSNQFAAKPLRGDSYFHTIAGGSFVEVKMVYQKPLIIGPVEDDGATLAFERIRFTPAGDANEYEGFVILDLLESGESSLSSEQEKLLIIRSNQLMKEREEACPFAPGNKWFDAMIESGDYSLNENGKYRDKSNRSRLTEYERRYRDEIKSAISSDPNSEYAILQNVMQARYGWGITAHKAMSYTWDEVTLSANAGDLGRHSEQYFRYLYTGASRARRALSVVRWEDVSPYDKTVFTSEPPNAQAGAKRPPLLKISSPDRAVEDISAALKPLSLEGIAFEHIGSSNYQERYRVSREGMEADIAFSYNKKGEVTSLVRQRGDTDAFLFVKHFLEEKSEWSAASSEMTPAYEYLKRKMGPGCEVKVLRNSNYRDEIEIRSPDGSCVVIAYYDGKGLVTRMDRIAGERGVFADIELCLSESAVDG